MHPKIWGKSVWTLLVSVVKQYPVQPLFDDTLKMKRFMISVGNVLPCTQSCRPNFYRHLADLPIDNYLVDQESLLKWIHTLYNLTLLEQGRNHLPYFEFIAKFYEVTNRETQIKNAIYYIANGYPNQPTFDEIMNYRNFFTYIGDYSKNWSYVIQNEVPSDKYLVNQLSLVQYVTYVFNISKPPAIPAPGTPGSVDTFTSNAWEGEGKYTKLGILVLLGVITVGSQFIRR